MNPAATPRLPAYALFGSMLAAAGLPLYMHAPKFYVDQYGISLAALGAVLFGLRLLDVVQDPLLGKLAMRLQARRGLSVAFAVAVMAAGMFGLFALTAPITPLWWFAIMLTLVFTAFSYLTICFYAQGVTVAKGLAGQGHLKIARWRETGALLGVCAAAAAPTLLGGYVGFAVAFVLLAMAATWFMTSEWQAANLPKSGLGQVVRDPVARRLLLVALANSAPVAVSSTLFLFFVEDRLNLPGWEGPFLLMFFLFAAFSAPFWSRAAERYGARAVLLFGMVLSILAFGYALMLGAGDLVPFALICIASGIALGADMTLLPALFAKRMEEIAPGAAEGFSLWSFVSKMTLALAAVSLLPLLELSGYVPGQTNSDMALWNLSLLYGAVPCVLKLIAIALLINTPSGAIQTPSPTLNKRRLT